MSSGFRVWLMLILSLLLALGGAGFFLLDTVTAITSIEPAIVVEVRTTCPTNSTCPIEQQRAVVCGWTVETLESERLELSASSFSPEIRKGSTVTIECMRGRFTNSPFAARLKSGGIE